MRNPYYLDPATPWFHVVNLSGGRSSAFMLHRILAAHDGRLPARSLVIFANTGKERPETLSFIARIQSEWSIPVVWLEYRYRDGAQGYEVVGHNSASTNGEPWEAMERAGAQLPSIRKRVCTSTLKVGVIYRYLWRELGLTKRQIRHAIGFRYDEPKRWKPSIYSECRAVYPMVEARVTRGDVAAFWRAQPFDLAIDSADGNCDLCFLKGRGNLVRAIRREPERADWWIERERRANRTLHPRGSFTDLLIAATETRRDMFGDVAVDESASPCFCGD